MAETKNIDAMASLVSEDIFNELKWNLSEKRDVNWQCKIAEHKKATHPTDIVFDYKDPYSSNDIFIQTDLKSYNHKSMQLTKKLNESIESLALQVECAKSSSEWKTLFKCTQPKIELHGMLFLFNNDDLYDKDLVSRLGNTSSKKILISPSSKIFIFTPKLIKFLMSCVENINGRRNLNAQSDQRKWEKIPQSELCGFYYPDKQSKIADQAVDHPATLEMITSGMLLYSYINEYYKEPVLNIFWDEVPTTFEPFIYMFEYLFNYQMLSSFSKVYLILPFRNEKTFDLFGLAKATYENMFAANDGQRKKLDKLTLILPKTFTSQIYVYEVADGRHFN
jgi:hypothetical protein